MAAISIIRKLNQISNIQVYYIGSYKGVEKQLISDLNIPYYSIQTGKLRRYLSAKNITDLFRVFAGLIQSLIFMLQFRKKTLIFSTGGFVSVPVIFAAKITGKRVFIHEQTSKIGLANQMASKFADKIFVSFEKSLPFFSAHKTYFSGYPLREECYENQINPVEIEGHKLNGLTIPIIMVTGGGNGSKLINNFIKKNLFALKDKYLIVHQVGKIDIQEFRNFQDHNYLPIEFIHSEMIDLFKLAQVVISRAGAGTVSELIALRKKSILIPLKIAQRNEQFFNAKEAETKLRSIIIQEEALEGIDLVALLDGFQPNVSPPSVPEKNATLFLCKAIQKHFES